MAATTLSTRITPIAQLLWANPVLIRDLRVLLRGAKSFWGIAAYLLCLGAIVLVGYGTAVGFGHTRHGYVSAVDIQEGLQGFYYFVFITIAALLSLIAPALTASSVTTERQRLTMDLLVTTPLSSAQLLTGKILSSVAFLALLLVLSLPASSLCIILGGATLGDVIRIYSLLAVDSLILAAIGIAFSCAVRASLAAIAWTYLAVIAFEITTGSFTPAILASRALGIMTGSGGSIRDLDPATVLVALNPFVAVFVGSGSIALFGFHVPLWLATAVVAILLIRLLLTTAACRLRLYGGNVYGSLRRQLLLISGLIAVPLAYELSVSVSGFGSTASDRLTGMLFLLTGEFLIPGALLYPSLFVPAHGDDLPPRSEEQGWYRPWRAFRPEHAGSLPFFHIWLVTVVAANLIGLWLGGSLSLGFAGEILLAGLYVSSLGALYWSLCRLVGALVSQLSGARALGFAFMAILVAIPLMVIGLIGIDIDQSPFSVVWIFYPLAHGSGASHSVRELISVTLWSTAFCYILAAIGTFLVSAIERRRRRVKGDAIRASGY